VVEVVADPVMDLLLPQAAGAVPAVIEVQSQVKEVAEIVLLNLQ
jgi:hypothetical protein